MLTKKALSYLVVVIAITLLNFLTACNFLQKESLQPDWEIAYLVSEGLGNLSHEMVINSKNNQIILHDSEGRKTSKSLTSVDSKDSFAGLVNDLLAKTKSENRDKKFVLQRCRDCIQYLVTVKRMNEEMKQYDSFSFKTDELSKAKLSHIEFRLLNELMQLKYKLKSQSSS